MSTEPGKEGGNGVEAPLFTSKPLHRSGELLGQSFEPAASSSAKAANSYGLTSLPTSLPAAGGLPAGQTHAYAGSAAEARHHWAMLVSTAALAWGKLSEEELLETGGDPRKLLELISDHYGIASEVASIQVRAFLDKHRM